MDATISLVAVPHPIVLETEAPPSARHAAGDRRAPADTSQSRWSNVARITPTPGDHYVESDCCTLCGVPWHYAPDLFDYDDGSCWAKRRPTTAREHERMIMVLKMQEIGCILVRYVDVVDVHLVSRAHARLARGCEPAGLAGH